MVMISIIVTYHVPCIRESHGKPRLCLPFHVNVQELVCDIIGVYADKNGAVGDIAVSR